MPFAEVFLDGVAIGTTPLVVKVAPGRHRLLFVNPADGIRQQRTVVIESGKVLRLTLQLGAPRGSPIDL